MLVGISPRPSNSSIYCVPVSASRIHDHDQRVQVVEQVPITLVYHIGKVVEYSYSECLVAQILSHRFKPPNLCIALLVMMYVVLSLEKKMWINFHITCFGISGVALKSSRHKRPTPGTRNHVIQFLVNSRGRHLGKVCLRVTHQCLRVRCC